jgi:ribonuclease HI
MLQEIIYTDGCCINNGKKNARGGIGVYFGENDNRNLSEKLLGEKQTNNRAELTAVIRALEVTSNSNMKIYTDSMYVQKGITNWIKNWEKNNWKTAKGTPVENKDLWKCLKELEKNKTVEYTYVKAHCGIEGNEKEDELANNGANK